MNQDDEPAFWEKAAAFVLALLAIGCSLALVKLGVNGLMGVCK